MNDIDLKFMKMAVEEAEKDQRDVKVGAVVVKDGKVLNKAHGAEICEGEHAEYTVLERKLQNVDLNGATLYTTLEPCIVGSHPGQKHRWPCAHWIIERRIKKVWIGIIDPNPLIGSRGVWHLTDNGVSVEHFPSVLQEKIRKQNEVFIEKQRRKTPRVLLADRGEEKELIGRFLNRLQLQTRGYYGSRLLWFCGPAGTGKTEVIRWLQAMAEERNIIKIAYRWVLSDNPAISYFRQLSSVKVNDIELVQKEGGSIEDFLCTAVASNLSEDTQPKILILDSDHRFSDLGKLSNLVGRLLSKLEHALYVGIIVATRKQPDNINTHALLPLALPDIEDMCKLNNWKIPQDIIKTLHSESKGNPLLVGLLYACYATTKRLPDSPDIKEALRDFLSHLNSMGQTILKKIAIGLSAPPENGEKTIDKDILLATFSPEERNLCERTIKELSDLGIVHVNPAVWMHDEVIAQIEKLLSKDEAVQQHYDFAQILRDKDPLGALWHLMSAEKVNEVIELLTPATEFSLEHLQILRLTQTFNTITLWFEDLTRQEVKENIKSEYLFYMGTAYSTLAEVEAKAENCKKAIKAYEEALKVRTLDRFPMDYAMTQNNLGNAYSTLAEVEAKAENCKKAIKAYEEALKVRTLDRFPMQYAMTQNNLGNAYRTLAEVEAKAENCKKAIKAYEEALKVFTKEEFPEIYPLVKKNLRKLLNFCRGE